MHLYFYTLSYIIYNIVFPYTIYIFYFVACDIIDLEWNETTTLLLEYEKM